MARGLLPLLLVAVLIIEAQCKNDTEDLMHINYNRRIIARREINCKEDEYNLDGQCCKKCKSGFVKNITCPTDIGKHCAQCESGKEYINHLNDLTECRRCSSCDRVFGLEVVKNCTPEEDTECACVKNHFCSSVACTECTECAACENGVIEKQCTSTSNTVCGIKETGMPLWPIALLAVLAPLAIVGAIFWWKRKQKGLTAKDNLSKVVSKVEPSCESVPLIDTDADLSSHIAGIVEEMTFQQVLTFIRHHRVPEPAIDQAVRDCPGDTSEQKIRLFRTWYQRHGIKGAYGTLVSSLRQLKMCAAADKIEEKLKAAVSSCQEGRRSYNGDTEQSKTCTQEGRNSSNDSAEQSKTYAGNLEETA
ncbi:tumor necrosis factor receptor superfamily member 6 [Empidonax traillii]|uniref:tumor necrosis factor receptor superfamily member 6 n=1 Tax=Empidonax traillii TaxID=164674 RepID=UPI000FFD15FB|nr:tumor necrosis factor receptor superfamily member 6 [Empidonax traillii]